MVEQPNKDFGYTMVRQFFFDTFRKLFYEQLTNSADSTLASIAAKSLKETKYHFKHSAEWVIRLGDGTEESKRRVSEAISFYWKYTDELFYQDEIDYELIDLSIAFDLTDLKAAWLKTVNEVLTQATIPLPSDRFEQKGGRKGTHSEHLGFLLAEMQYMQRTYPNSVW
jgi:ring-1,2-phenylacetyl-CoA epoxidase subunit PaaC